MPHGFLGGCRIGGLHPGLVGHLLRPGPRLSRELAGGPLCHRTVLEQSLRASTHRPVGGAAEGHRGRLLLIWTPYYCPIVVLHKLQLIVPRQAGPTLTLAPPAPPINSPATSEGESQRALLIYGWMCASGQQGAPGGQHNGSFLLPRLSVHLGSHKSLPFSTLTH